jgi:hypothetical protein
MVLVAGSNVVAISPSRAQTSEPTLALDRTEVAAGEEIAVNGSGWAPDSTLILEICGSAADGALACDVAHQQSSGVGPTGAFSSNVTVAMPETGCPCVVRATDRANQLSVTAAVTFHAPQLEVASIAVSGGSWTELFGAPSNRTLKLTLVNTGEVAVDAPELTVSWGRRGSAGRIELPEIPRMEPGDTQSLAARLPRGALAFGRYKASATVAGLGEPATVVASESVYPWGLAALVVLVLVAAVLLYVRLRRKSAAEPEQPVEAVPVPEPAVAADAEPVEALAALASTEVPMDQQQVIDLRDGEPEPAVIAVAAMSDDLRQSFDWSADRARDETRSLEGQVRSALDREAKSSLERWGDLSYDERLTTARSLVAGMRARAADPYGSAQARRDEVKLIASALQSSVEQIVTSAEVVAAKATEEAARDRELARQELVAAERERQQIVRSAHDTVDRMIADLEGEIDALKARFEATLAEVLQEVTDERRQSRERESSGHEQNGTSDIADELEGRLSAAIFRALSSSGISKSEH